MSESLHIVCPHCSATNRIPVARRQEAPRCGKCHTPLFDGKPLEAGAASFMKHLECNDIPLLVDFWAPWCGPCHQFAPVYESMADEHEDIVFAKVNTEEERELAGHFQIRSIPTLMVFREQIIVFSQPGALPPAALSSVIEKVRELDMDVVRREVEAQADKAGQ